MKTIFLGLCVLPAGAAMVHGGEAAGSRALVADGGVRVATWQGAPNPSKPYIAQLFAPGGEPVPVLDDSPADHVHHHGLMFALSVDGTDFWTERRGGGGFGRQVPVESGTVSDSAGFARRLQWKTPDGEVLLEERRTVAVRSSGAGVDRVHWLDWSSVLKPASGRDSVRLSGHHYFGLGMRFLPAWSGKGTFVWQDPAGQRAVRGTEMLTSGAWCAVRCEINGEPITVLAVDGPGNARPASWFTMTKPFCYLSATPGLDRDPEDLEAGESWILRYGIAVLSGNAGRPRLQKLANDWRARAVTNAPNPQPIDQP